MKIDTNLPQVSVSVVTYNSAQCLPIFLDSLRNQNSVNWEALFYDNVSHDETRDVIKKAAMGELFLSDSNIGYGRAHNRNFPRCRGRYLLLLNPDLQFGPDLISRLVPSSTNIPNTALSVRVSSKGPNAVHSHLDISIPAKG